MPFHVSFPGLGIKDLTINPVAFTLNIGGSEIKIMWYGLIIASAFLLTLMIALAHSKRFRFSGDDILDCFIWGIPFSIIGARLYYVAFSWDAFKDDLSLIFQTRQGGMAFYGGVIGGILALALVTSIKKRPISDFMDFFAPYLALGQAIGRWGNFFNQEAFGGNTSLPWGMISEGTKEYLERLGPGFNPNSPVHPTFSYEFLGNIIIFIFLLEIRERSTFRGESSAWYLAMYGLLRYIVEGLRTDPLLIGNTNIRVSQLLSALLVIGSIFFLLIRNIKQRKTPEAEWVLPFVGESFVSETSENTGESELSEAIEVAENELEAETVEAEEVIEAVTEQVEELSEQVTEECKE